MGEDNKQPLPNLQHIVPFAHGCRNVIKGGADVMSRMLRNIHIPWSGTQITPLAFLFLRFVLILVHNAFRLWQVRQVFPKLKDGTIGTFEQYRGAVKRTGSFKAFICLLLNGGGFLCIMKKRGFLIAGAGEVEVEEEKAEEAKHEPPPKRSRAVAFDAPGYWRDLRLNNTLPHVACNPEGHHRRGEPGHFAQGRCAMPSCTRRPTKVCSTCHVYLCSSKKEGERRSCMERWHRNKKLIVQEE